ncbi:MAG: hypothetical protein Q7W13_04090 [Bacteroidia bacterium]|nr:hypothetical protein [Bacteroidia bacterium]
MNKIIGAVLIIAGLAVGYVGFNKISESTKSANVLGLKIEASNQSGKQQGYLFLGLGAILLLGGFYTLKNVKK